jgi:hypothetical protein
VLREQEEELNAMRGGGPPSHGRRSAGRQRHGGEGVGLNADSRLVYPDGHASVLGSVGPGNGTSSYAPTPEPPVASRIADDINGHLNNGTRRGNAIAFNYYYLFFFFFLERNSSSTPLT